MFKVINKIMIVLCYLPFVYLALFYSFVLRAIIKIGKIPTYNNPDPKDLKFDVHREIVYKSFDWLVYGLIVLAALFLIVILSKKLIVKRIHLRILAIGVIVIIFHLLADPFDAWFLD